MQDELKTVENGTIASLDEKYIEEAYKAFLTSVIKQNKRTRSLIVFIFIGSVLSLILSLWSHQGFVSYDIFSIFLVVMWSYCLYLNVSQTRNFQNQIQELESVSKKFEEEIIQ